MAPLQLMPNRVGFKVGEGWEVNFKGWLDVTGGNEIELETHLSTDVKVGLTQDEQLIRLQRFGRNEVSVPQPTRWFKFFACFTDSTAVIVLVAIFLSAIARRWLNVTTLTTLLVSNAALGHVVESRAGSALVALQSTFPLKSRVRRDGGLVEVESAQLVPGDVIVLRLGDTVPADCRLLGLSAIRGDGRTVSVDKFTGQIAYASSVVKRGQMMAIVIKTGSETFIGRAANLISATEEKGPFQLFISQVGNFLVLATIGLALVLLNFQLFWEKELGFTAVLNNFRKVAVLTVAAVPLSLPTVLSVTLAVGAKQLAAKQVIVRRLTAIEAMASVSVLCSDKTGTLTLNQPSFDEPWLMDGFSKEDILLYSFLASEPGANDPIEKAVRSAATAEVPCLRGLTRHEVPGYKITSFGPFDPTSKRSQATVMDLETNEIFQVSKGAPTTIIDLVGGNVDASHAVSNFARRGLRALGVARTYPGLPDAWHLVGLLSLRDPLRPDSPDTVARCHEFGIQVKITGDQLIVAKEVAYRLGMQRAILDADKLIGRGVDEETFALRCMRADGFAQANSEHKCRIVELLQKRGLVVGMTGGGVNDAPALKRANVGIAVHGCTDAARSASDIVLLAPGLSTILDGITISRAIFQRLQSYALYRTASTVHILIFFFILILAKRWQMNEGLLILIAVLNDVATIAIAFDDAPVSRRPEKWRVGQLIFLSTLLGTILALISFAHFFIALNHIEGYKLDNLIDPSASKLNTLMYLHISSAPNFLIFSTRVTGFFWGGLPSWPFLAAILAIQTFATLTAITGLGSTIPGIQPSHAFAVLLISLVSFVLLDLIKVVVVFAWSFQLTATFWPTPARRSKLTKRKVDLANQLRLGNNVKKVRKILIAIKLINRCVS
ncbi:hypothetical protein L0F63_001420 [Massospora cicadina]|nr:hypothetical protein L0F63_001420 [Massospora cicadina]